MTSRIEDQRVMCIISEWAHMILHVMSMDFYSTPHNEALGNSKGLWLDKKYFHITPNSQRDHFFKGTHNDIEPQIAFGEVPKVFPSIW